MSNNKNNPFPTLLTEDDDLPEVPTPPSGDEVPEFSTEVIAQISNTLAGTADFSLFDDLGEEGLQNHISETVEIDPPTMIIPDPYHYFQTHNVPSINNYQDFNDYLMRIERVPASKWKKDPLGTGTSPRHEPTIKYKEEGRELDTYQFAREKIINAWSNPEKLLRDVINNDLLTNKHNGEGFSKNAMNSVLFLKIITEKRIENERLGIKKRNTDPWLQDGKIRG